MTRFAALFLAMLRFRVAAMLWMFMLLGAARYSGLDQWGQGLDYVWAALVLACGYVAATCLNDIADVEVDRINHPKDSGRPLVTGAATARDLMWVYAVAAPLTLACSLPLGVAGLAVAACSLLIGWTYSFRPLELSHRTYLAPLILAVAYVLVPYTLGVLAAGAKPGADDAAFCLALYLLFLARINLKDFRDREGDRAYGKPTLLLRFGKDATCAVSLTTLVASTVVLVAALRPPLAVVTFLIAYLLAIASRLYALWRAEDRRGEQLAIGIGARAGNGLLITLLAWLLLADHGAPTLDVLLILGGITTLFMIDFAVLVIRPHEARIGYKA